MSLDGFGRLRTVNCFTTFNYYVSPITENSSLDIDVWVTTNSGGTATYSSNNYVELSATTNDYYVIRTTKQPMEYQPGKCRLIYMTGVLLAESLISGDTLSAKIGLFNIDSTTPTTITSGVYYQTDGTNLQWAETTQDSTTSVNQSSWNVDIFDGTGPSGKTLTIDDAKTNTLVVIDQEWLGVGRIRCGFIIDGIIYYAHTFNHSDLTIQYTATPRQRLGYYLYVTSTASNTYTMRQMCCTSIIEGGYFPLCGKLAVSTLIGGVSLSNPVNKYILLALKLNSIYFNALIKLIGLSVLYTAGKVGIYQIQLHSTNGTIGSITGTLTYSAIPNSMTTFAIGDGTQYIETDGFITNSGIISDSSSIVLLKSIEETLLTRNICTIYDTIYLVGIGNTSNDKMYGAIEFVENI